MQVQRSPLPILIVLISLYRPVQSPSMLTICLQVLQDPNKIPRLSMDKRRDIVIQFMQQVEEDKQISDDHDLAVMKKRLWQGAMRRKGDSISHLLASWYAECGSLAWPRLSLVLLKKVKFPPLSCPDDDVLTTFFN